MIDFQPLDSSQKALVDKYLSTTSERGCEYGFVNLYLWGRQKAAFIHDTMVFFSQFNRRSVYLYPVGTGDKKPVLEALMEDAKKRGIPCRLSGLTEADRQELDALFPGKFRFHYDRDSFDYVYSIEALATLKGKKLQKKRNHLNRFRDAHPDHSVEPITEENLPEVTALVEQWYRLRLAQDPHADYQMEQAAIQKALKHKNVLDLEGLMLRVEGKPVAMTMGSRLNLTTFDIHFEKALDIADGAYAAINNAFARYLQEKYPELLWLNREDDMGLEGLRKAKLSYNPDHMIEKSWAHLTEEAYEY